MLTKLQIDRAVAWWVTALEGCLNSYIKQSGGEIKKRVFVADVGRLFGLALTRLLAKDVNQIRTLKQGLLVDFHPEGLLKQACEQIGLNVFLPVLPTKTHMRFVSGGVQVGSSFGSREKVVL